MEESGNLNVNGEERGCGATFLCIECIIFKLQVQSNRGATQRHATKNEHEHYHNHYSILSTKLHSNQT